MSVHPPGDPQMAQRLRAALGMAADQLTPSDRLPPHPGSRRQRADPAGRHTCVGVAARRLVSRPRRGPGHFRAAAATGRGGNDHHAGHRRSRRPSGPNGGGGRKPAGPLSSGRSRSDDRLQRHRQTLRVVGPGLLRGTRHFGPPWLLYRDFVRTTMGDDGLEARVTTAVNLAIASPDVWGPAMPGQDSYLTAWAPGTRVTATVSADAITLVLGAPGVDGLDLPAQRQAVQALVWTATAAAQRNVPVTISVAGGGPVVGGIPAGVFRRPTDATTELAPVWITSPGRFASVWDSRVVVEGQACTFEGTVQWELRQGDVVVSKGFATATSGVRNAAHGRSTSECSPRGATRSGRSTSTRPRVPCPPSSRWRSPSADGLPQRDRRRQRQRDIALSTASAAGPAVEVRRTSEPSRTGTPPRRGRVARSRHTGSDALEGVAQLAHEALVGRGATRPTGRSSPRRAASWRRRSCCASVSLVGVCTSAWTMRSPRPVPRRWVTPRPRSVTVSPGWVPGAKSKVASRRRSAGRSSCRAQRPSSGARSDSAGRRRAGEGGCGRPRPRHRGHPPGRRRCRPRPRRLSWIRVPESTPAGL
jgi:hypothetical protein